MVHGNYNYMSEESTRVSTEDVYSDLYSNCSLFTSTTSNDIDHVRYSFDERAWLLYGISISSGLIFGYSTGITSGILISVTPEDLKRPTYTDFDKQVITSIACFGCLVGTLLAQTVTKKYGRKSTLFLCGFSFILNSFLVTLPIGWTSLLGIRLATGVTLGMSAQCTPVYLNEISPAILRNNIQSCGLVAASGGQLLASILAWNLMSKPEAWKYLFALNSIPVLLFMLFLDILPESPQWLVAQTRLHDAEASIKAVYSNATPYQIQVKLSKIIHHLSKIRYYDDEVAPLLLDQSGIVQKPLLRFSTYNGIPKDVEIGKRTRRKHHLMEPRTKRALFVACMLMFFQQTIGLSSFMYYSAVVFTQLGSEEPLLLTSVLAVTSFVFTCIAVTTIDKIGRRKVLLCTILIMTAGLISSVFGIEYNNFFIMMISLNAYTAAYTAAMGIIPWKEVNLLPLNRRQFGSTCISCTHWLTNTIVSMYFLSVTKQLGHARCMLVLAFLTVFNWLFVYWWYPEVKGLPLDEIGTIFEHGIDVNYVYRNYNL